MQHRFLSFPKRILSFLPKRSFISAVELKGTHSVYFDEAKHLSPFNGLVFRELNAPEKMYKMQSEMANVNLVKELFYLHGEEFRATQNKAKIGYFLTPPLLAQIVHHLNTNTYDLPETRAKLTAEILEQSSLSFAKISNKRAAV